MREGLVIIGIIFIISSIWFLRRAIQHDQSHLAIVGWGMILCVWIVITLLAIIDPTWI